MDEVRSGSLLFAIGTPGQFIAAPRLATDVAIAISGPIARTKVTQRFENTSDAWVEGTYVFPLPDSAAVDTLKLQIGSRFIEGKIEEKQKAKAIYDAAKQAGKKASLLSQQRPNIFTNAVANIGPGETVVVQIEYQETIAVKDNQFALRFPMVVAPRYSPAPQVKQLVTYDTPDITHEGWAMIDPVPDREEISAPVLPPQAGPINPISMTIDLDAGFVIGDVRSSSHDVLKTRIDGGHMRLMLGKGRVPADRDFELIWTPKSGTGPSAALFTETVGDETFYLLMLTPPAGPVETAPQPRDVTFVLDTSGSMQGASIRQAREALALAITRLRPSDAFNVVQFNSNVDMLFAAPRPATEVNMARALGYVRSLDASGGTQMLPALKAALSQSQTVQQHNVQRLHQVIFLTDGAIGNEHALFQTIADQRGPARIFTVGIGSAPNSYFMSRAAELGQGTFTHIGQLSQVRTRMEALFEKLERPAVTNIAARWPQEAKVEAWPALIPDVYHGETLIVAAQTQTKRGRVTLSGDHEQTRWQVDLPLENARTRPGIAKLWARKKIASLETARASYGADHEKIDAAVLSTALMHGLVSRLTSLVAVDVAPSRPANEPITQTKVPHNLPHGWDFGSVFGETTPAAAPPRTRAAALQFGAQHASAAPGIVLPRTASLWQLKLALGIGVLIAAIVLFWCQRRDA